MYKYFEMTQPILLLPPGGPGCKSAGPCHLYSGLPRMAVFLTPLSNAGLWSRNSNFRLRFQACKLFRSGSNVWKFLALTPEWLGPLNAKYYCIICTTRLPHKLCLWNRNPNSRPRSI